MSVRFSAFLEQRRLVFLGRHYIYKLKTMDFFPSKNNSITLLPSQKHGCNLLMFHAGIVMVNHGFAFILSFFTFLD